MYQTTMFIVSILGPGTIFLMIVGALEVALDGRISMWTSFVLNLIPVGIFVILCFTTKGDTQVTFGVGIFYQVTVGNINVCEPDNLINLC